MEFLSTSRTEEPQTNLAFYEAKANGTDVCLVQMSDIDVSQVPVFDIDDGLQLS